MTTLAFQGSEILEPLARLGFPDILLWLLTFAVVFGVLSSAGKKGIPESKAARGIISIVVAFMVMFAAPTQLIGVLEHMSSSLVMVIVGLLLVIVFLEAAGIKSRRRVAQLDKEGNPTGKFYEEAVSIFEKRPMLFVAIFAIAITLIFFASGGWDLLGIQFNVADLPPINLTGLVFMLVIVITVGWMIANPK